MATAAQVQVSSWTVERMVIVVGFALGAVFGFAGSMFPAGNTTQAVLYAISSIGIVAASIMVACQQMPRGAAVVATGFTVLAMAEVVLWAGGPSAQGSFTAGTMFYIPALLLLGVPAALPIVSRVTSVLAAVLFGIYTFAVLAGQGMSSSGGIVLGGYALLTIAMLGWVWWAWRGGSEAARPAA
ncbi:MAG TPA: hypothetical protein VF166_03315 [Gemmatimonadaceae bacterium]